MEGGRSTKSIIVNKRLFKEEITMKGIILGLLFLALLWRPDPSQANFYQGKTVTIISGTMAGSAYDPYARLFASHLGKHVPGNPGFMGANMPGGGGCVG